MILGNGIKQLKCIKHQENRKVFSYYYKEKFHVRHFSIN